ncbi:hypothetical protein SO802_031988 [Lithocarpus litseifolius]|uniref:Uncharacterized protein n=1 Tax=Lithocarpus litseifolius TaxID=425828 RepID=A0AAW2BPB7_9ROSI
MRAVAAFPPVRATRGPSKYLDVWDLPDDQVIELPLNSMHQPFDEGARAFTGFLGTIAQNPHMCPIRYLNWKDILEELKEECWRLVEQKYVVSTNPTAYAEDWDVLVDHWYTEDTVIESEKNRDPHSKQEDLHTAGSCSFAVHAAKKAKVDERPIERARVQHYIQYCILVKMDLQLIL